MPYSNPLEFRPATISAGRGTYLTISLSRTNFGQSSIYQNDYYEYGILGLDEFEFISIPETAYVSSWEGILGGGMGLFYDGAESTGSLFETKWEGKYAVSSTRSYNYGDVALSGTRDGILYFEADGETIYPGQGGTSVYGKSFDPGKGVVSVNDLIINDLGIIYNNEGSAYTNIKYGSLSDVSLSIDNFYLSELNAQRLVGESGTISVSEQESNTITELFTIHADAYGKHTIYVDVKDVSSYSGSGVDTDKFIQGNATTTLGDDFQLYWGVSGLENPNKSDLTLIGSNESGFIWDTNQQDSNLGFQQISLYAEIFSDDFAEYDEKAEITVWGGAGKTTYEWTAAQDDNTSFWKKIETSSFSLESSSGPYAKNSAGQHLSQTLSLQGYGGRIELDVLFGDSWENESIQIYVNGNSFSFNRDFRSALTESTQSKSGYSATVYPFNSYANLTGNSNADQAARISIEVPAGIESVQLGLGTTLNQDSSDEFLAIDNLSVIEPEITTYTLKVADSGPVLSLGRVGYLDSKNNFISTEGNISEGMISVVEILVRDGSGNSINMESDREIYVHYEVVTGESSAKEGVDFYVPKGVMSTENYNVESFINFEPGGNVGYLYITPLNDAIAEGTEVVSIKLVDASGEFDSGQSYRSYVVDGEGDEVAIKITDPSDQAWTKAISITQKGRDDDYIVASVDGKVSVDIRLRSAIEEDRNVTLSTGDILTFTKENWDIPQTVAIELGSGDISDGYVVINAESTDNTITLSNTYNAGDIVTATINGISVSYTVSIDDIKTLEQEEVHTLTDDFRRNGVSLGSLDWSEQTWQNAGSINGSLVANGSEIWRELPAGIDWNQATDFRLSYDKNNTRNLLIKLYKVSNGAKLAEKPVFTYNNKSAGAETISTTTDSSGVSLKTYLQQGYNAIGIGGFAGGTNYIDNIELEVEIGPRYEDKSSASALSAIAAKLATQINDNASLNGSVIATVDGNIVTINSRTFNATIPTVTTNAPGNGSWSSGDVRILSHDNTSEAKVLLFEGGSVVAEGHQFIVTKNADVLEGAQGQEAALTISRVSADDSRPVEVFIKSTNGNLANLRSEQVRTYRPLLTGSEREIVQYEGVSRTDEGKGYTIEMWVSLETKGQMVQLLDISSAQTQFDSIALSGIYEAGDRIDTTISDMTVSYIVAAGDIGSETSTTYTLKDDFLSDGRSLGNLDWSNQTWQNETSTTGTLKARGKDAWRELPKGVDWTKATDVSLSFTKSNKKLLWIKLYKVKDGIVEDEAGLYRYDRKSTKTETISSTDKESLDIKTYLQQGFNAIGMYGDSDGWSYIDDLELSITVDSYTPLDTAVILDRVASNLAAKINNDAAVGNLVKASAFGNVISIDPSATDIAFSLSTVATNGNGNSDNTQKSAATASKSVKDSASTGSLIIDEQGRVVFTVEGVDETSATARSSSSIAANEWQHIAIAHDDASQKYQIYINGVFDAEADVLDGVGILSEASKDYIVSVGGVGEAQVRDLRIINKTKESEGIQASMFDEERRSAGVMLDAPLNGIADTGKHSVGQPTESASGSFADEPVYAVKMNANSSEANLFVDRTDDNIWTGNTTFSLELKDNSSLYGHAGADQVTINLFDDDKAGFTLHKLNRLVTYKYEKLESNVQLIGTDGSVNEIVITPANAEKTDNEPGHPYSIGYTDTVILPGIAMSTDGINALTISGWFKGETEKNRSLLELETTDGSNSIRAIISEDRLRLFLPTSDGELEYNGIIDHDQGDWHFWAISLGSRKVLDPTTKVMVQQRHPEVWVDGIEIELTEKTESTQADIVESFDYAGIYLRGDGQQVYSTGVTVQTGGKTTAEVIQQMKNNAVLLEGNLVYAIDMSTVNAEVVGVVASEEETWTKLSSQDISESGVSAEIELFKLLRAKDDEGYIVNSSLSDEVVLGISLNTMPTSAVYLKLDQNEYADQLDITLGDGGNPILAFDETNYSTPQTIDIKTKSSDNGSLTLPVRLSVVDGTGGSEYKGFAATLNIRLDSPLPDLDTRGSSLATPSTTHYAKIERIGDDLLNEVDTTTNYLDWENNTVQKTVTHTLIDDLLTNGRSLGSLDWSNEDWQDFSALSNTLQAKQKNAWRKLPDEVDWTKATDFSLSFRRRNSQQLWINLYKIENNEIVEKVAIRQYSANDAVSSQTESMDVDQNGTSLVTYLQQGFNAIGIWQNKNDTGFLDDLELSIIAPRASGTEVEGEVATFRISLTDQNGEATVNASQDTIIYLKKGAASTADWSDVTPATTHQLSGLIKYSEETGSIGELTSLSNIETLADNTSIKGYIKVPVSGFYTFYADTNGETVVKINDQTLIHVNGDGLNISSASDPIYLREGGFAEVSIDYNHSGTLSGQEGGVNINWTRPDNSEHTQSEITGLTQVDQLHAVIPAGSSSIDLTIEVADDSVSENAETFELEITEDRLLNINASVEDIYLGLDKGATLDGSAYLQLPTINLGEEYTIAAWAKLNDNSMQTPTLFYAKSGDDQQGLVSFGSNSANGLEFSSWNSSGSQLTSLKSGDDLISLDQWHHLVVSVSGTKIRLFVDGKLVGSQDSGQAVSEAGSRNTVYVGRGSNWTEAWEGKVKDLQIYDQFFDEDNINQILSEAVVEQDLVDLGLKTWYPLRSANGSTYESIALSGTFDVGDIVTATVNGFEVSYTVDISDLGDSSVDYTLKDDFDGDGRSLGSLDWSQQTWQNETGISGELKARGQSAWRLLPTEVNWSETTDFRLRFSRYSPGLLWIKLFKVENNSIVEEVGILRYSKNEKSNGNVDTITDMNGKSLASYLQEGFNAIGIYGDGNYTQTYIDNLDISIEVETFKAKESAQVLTSIAANLADKINSNTNLFSSVSAASTGAVISLTSTTDDSPISVSTTTVNIGGNGDNTQASDIVGSAIAASVIGSVGFTDDDVVPLIYNDGPMAAIKLSAGNILNLSSSESVDSALNSLWSIRLLEDITLIKGLKSLPVQYELVNNNPNRMPETGLVLSGQVAIDDYRLTTVVVDDVEKVDAEMATAKMVITQNDTLGIDIKEQDIALTEGAVGQLQSIRLSAQPLETVTVLVQAKDDSEVIIRQNDSSPLKSPLDDTVLHLTFTPENWDMAQSFYIIAVDDDVAENKSEQLIHLTTISEDSRWDRKTSLSKSDGTPTELNPFSVIVTDNDVAGVITESITYNISKSANGFAYLALSSEPTDDVSIMVTPVGDSVNPAKVTLNDRSINRSESMVFNKDNWNIAQSIELTAVDDEDITGTVDTHVAITTESNDPYYNNKSWPSVNVRIIDNDLPTAKIVPVLDATENGSPGAFKIVLDAPAPNDVGSTGISVAYAITGFNMDDYLKNINSVPVDLEALVGSYTLSPGGLLNGIARIAPGSTESQVFIVPIDDQFADEYILDGAGNSGKQLTFELTETAANSPYKLSSNIREQTIYVNIINNDAAGVALIRSGSLLMAAEGGEDAQLGIVLLSQPNDKVSVSLLELTDTATSNRITGSGGRDWDGDLQQANADEIEPSASVEFDAKDWYIPQVISVGAKADQFREDGGLGSGYENTGIHSTKVKLQFQSDDDAYDSENKSQEHFTNSTEFDLLILDESLSENTAESINSTLDSLQEGFALLELPFLGSMDGKFGNPFDTITKKLLPLVDNLGDNLTVDRLQSTIDLSGIFDTSSISVQNVGLSNAYIQLDLGWSDEYSLFSLPLDASLGIPGLGLTSSGSIDADLKFDAGIGLHIPFSTQNGMDINLDLAEDKTFISAELELNLSDDFSFNGGLGFLSFQGVNIGPESTGMNAIFDVTLDKDPSKSLLSYKDLIAGDFDLGDYVAFGIDDASSAQLGISATAYTSAKAVMPNVDLKLTTDLSPIFSAIDSGYSNGNSQYTISLDDISLDIGSFATDMLSPVLETIGDILNPIRPLVDAFYTDTKIFATLGMEEEMDQDEDGIVTPLDMLIHYANTFGDEKDQRNAQKTKTFLSTLSSVYSIIDEFDSLSGNGESFAIDIGSYEVSIDADPESGESASNAKAQSTESTSTLANTKNGVIADSTTGYRQKIGSAVNKLYSLGFSIPLIESPSTVVDLLLGKDVDLFTWTIPGLESSLSIEQDFTLWPAPKIDGIVEGSLTAEAFITLGFDTTGFSDWKSKGFAFDESWRAFDGFFVEDKAGDEVVLSADLGVGVAGSVGVAKATVTGGIGASLGFDLIDSGEFNGTGDDKLRASEIYSRISNPLSLFDLTGSLSAYLDAQLQVGIDMGLWDKWWTVWEEEFDIELFSFSLGASGSHGNGPISGSTIGFDANFNGRIDINEPAIQTKSNGLYSDLKIDLRTFDLNQNGKIDPNEGRQIAFGGQDTVGGHDVSTVMFAPYETIISPLTTVYSVALMQGMDKGEARKMIQSLFSIKDWDFTTEEPINAIRNEGLIPNISARKAALAHTYMNWVFDKLLHEAEKVANLDKLPLNQRVSLTENYSLNLIEQVGKVDDFTDFRKVALAYAQAMMLTLNNYAKEIGGKNTSPELLRLVLNNMGYFNSLNQKSFANNDGSDDFLARLSVIKSQLLFRSENYKHDYLSAVGAQLEMNAASRWFDQEQLRALEETGLVLSKSIIRLTQESDSNLLRSGVLVDIQSLLGDISLTDDSGKRDAIKKISVSTVSDGGTIKSAAYNPISGNGARFYDFDGDDIADYMLFSSAPDNQAQSPSIVGGAASLRTVFAVKPHGVVATLDPNQLDIEAGVVISATLETRATSVSSIYYVVLDKSELEDVDEIFSDLDLLKSRSNVLFSSLEIEDVTLPEGMIFNRSINLVNGQAIRFFQVDNAELSELESSLDARLSIIDTSDLIEGHRGVVVSSESGPSFRLELMDKEQGLNSLIGSMQDKAPILDFSYFTEATKISGELVLSREAAFDALTGFYRVLDQEGSVLHSNGVDVLKPGHQEYASMALHSDNIVGSVSNLAVDDRAISRRTFSLSESSYLAPYSIVNGNQYFGYAAANPDGINHFRVLGQNTFGLEDMLGGGDRDFDDHVFKYIFTEIA